MTDEARCHTCRHLWRWHHAPRRPDVASSCSRCQCDEWINVFMKVGEDERQEERREEWPAHQRALQR